MNYEDYYSITYSPIKAIEIMSEIIYMKTNEDWNFFEGKISKESAEELLALNHAINLCAKEMLDLRK